MSKKQEQWNANTAANHYTKQIIPIEVKRVDGLIQLLSLPGKTQIDNVTHWRPVDVSSPEALVRAIQHNAKQLDGFGDKIARPNFKLAPAPAPEPKIVPTVYRHNIQFDWLRTFPFMQRIAILFGAPLHVIVRIPTQHNPGNFQPFCAGIVTKDLNAKSVLKRQMEDILESQKDSIPKELP